MPFLYYLSTPDEDLELAQAELWAMTGAEADGRVGVSAFGCDIARAAYVSVCAEVIARSTSYEGLLSNVAAAGVATEDFRIEVRKAPPKPPIGGDQIARELADVIAGYPDLTRPKERFLALCSEGDWWFGRVISTCNSGFRRQNERPHDLSIALTARHARALVNLVAAPGDDLLDPCCGVGTALLEAEFMGVRAHGCEIQPANAFQAAGNLRHFGLPRRLAVGDGRAIGGMYDAAAIDFPYGHSTHVAEGLYEEILNNVAPRAFRIAVILGRAGEELFASLGLDVLRCARVRSNRLVRHFYVLRGLRAATAPHSSTPAS